MKSAALLFLVSLPALLHAQNARVDALYNVPAGAPGCAIGVVQNGKTVHAKGYGLADLEHNIPLSPKSVFYMASVSKQFTAMSVLMLAEEKKLNLEDSIRKTLPELPPYAGSITIRQLLHHTSGLRDYLTLGDVAGYSDDYVFTEEGSLRMIARQKALNFEPGTEFLYSNSGYFLLSQIVKRVSGKSLDAYAREHIFAPLGMTSTRFQHDHTNPVPDRALGYVRRGGQWHTANSMLDVAGDGGLYSNLEDLARWVANFDEPKVGAQALAEMRKPGKFSNGKEVRYGMGLTLDDSRGMMVFQHGGALAGYRTMIAHFPAERLSVISLCNAAGAPGVGFYQVAENWIPALAKNAPPPSAARPKAPERQALSEEEKKRWTGAWWSDELAVLYRIEERAGSLMVEAGDAPATALLAAGSGKVQFEDRTLTLQPDGAGFTLDAGRVRGIRFERR